MENELLDLVDGHDRIIGKIDRSEYFDFLKNGQGFVRVAELYIMNDEGKLLTPIRTANKKIAPNGFDSAAAGHVSSGDDYLQTIIREAKEEILLDITEDDIEFVAIIKNTSLKYIRGIYLLRSNNTPTLNPDDFVKAVWLTPDEILTQIEAGHPAKSMLPSAIKVLKIYIDDFHTPVS